MLDVGKVMVQISVAGLVGTHVRDHVPKGRVRWQLIVLDSLGGCWHVFPVIQFAVVDLLQEDSVGVHCLLLEVANKSMARRWRNHVRQEVPIEKDSLCCGDHESVEDPWVAQSQEKEEVHTFVLRLLQQVVDPAVVALQGSQTAQVALHASNHAWDTSYGLEEDDAVHPATLVQRLWVVARSKVKRGACQLDDRASDPVTDTLRLLVGVLNLFNLLLGVDRVSHAVALGV